MGPKREEELATNTAVGGGPQAPLELSVLAKSGDAVDWDQLEGDENPQNWSSTKKWTTIVVVSAITFNQAMSSTIFAPGQPQAMRDLGSVSPEGATLSISIYVIGLALGPLVLSPLSERYGRMPVMHGTNGLFLVASVLCATSVNLPMLLVFRFAAGAATVSLGGGYVADVMAPELRQRAMNVWTVGPVLAPIVGPIVGGYVSMRTTWRWTFGLLSITGAVAFIATFAFLEETYAPRLRELKTRRAENQAESSACLTTMGSAGDAKGAQRTSIAKPFQLLVSSPALIVVSLFLSVAYSYMYIMFTTFTHVFSTTYGFNAGEVGLSYLGLGIGCLLGQYGLDLFMRRYLTLESIGEGNNVRPERNLPVLMLAGVLLAVGLFWYGWALEYQTHWIVPIIGTAVCGTAINLFFIAVQTYIVEVYTVYAASALAASTAIRCTFGLTVPLAAPALYQRLGFGWGNTLLGFLALTIVPTAFFLWRGSESLRTKS